MQNLQADLIELLKDEDNLVVDNQLNKNKIIESALKVEPYLISLLIKNETFKKHFLREIEEEAIIELYQNQEYKLIGMPFYNKDNREGEFEEKLISIV